MRNHRTKGTLRFALKEPNSTSQSPIQVIFSLGKEKFRKSVGYRIEPQFWDSEKQRVKNVIKASNKDEINRELNNLEAFINDGISDLKKIKFQITIGDIEAIYKDYSEKGLNGNEIVVSDDFFSCFSDFIEAKEKILPKNRGNKSQTVEAYRQTLKFLEGFAKETGYIVTFQSIDIQFYYSFREYMQVLKKPDGKCYSLNTIGKHMKTLKTFLNYASNMGVNQNFKYKLPEFKIVKEETTAVYLTKEEKIKLFKYDFSKHPELEIARDVFLIGCEIGQRVSDYNNLRDSQVVEMEGKKYFKFKQKKTGQLVYCYITPAVQFIMNSRYNGNPPKSILEQKLNANIKEAARMVGINDLVRFERTEGGKLVVTEVYKYELISSHTARRTYCSLLFQEGVAIQEIMIQSGHKTEREFRKYIRISKEDQVRKVTSSEKFNNSFISLS